MRSKIGLPCSASANIGRPRWERGRPKPISIGWISTALNLRSSKRQSASADCQNSRVAGWPLSPAVRASKKSAGVA